MRITSPTSAKWTCQITLWLLSHGLLAGAATPAWAEESAVASQGPPGIAASLEMDEPTWTELPPIAERAQVRILFAGQKMDAGSECYVITHGMGGTASGDSFHRLAAAIHRNIPRACVIRLDWSEKASAKIGGFPHPWKVAGSIDEVGDQAALVLKKEGLNPAHAILIGESFGNWVNARIAHQLGGVQGILALNPANEGGGYVLPDLRKHARRSWSFHTYSVFDTTLEIADSDFWLETPADTTHWGQHVAGIRWLAARIEANDMTWLNMDKPLPQRKAGLFRAMATMDGQLSDKQQPRERPVPAEDRNSSADNRQLSEPIGRTDQI